MQDQTENETHKQGWRKRNGHPPDGAVQDVEAVLQGSDRLAIVSRRLTASRGVWQWLVASACGGSLRRPTASRGGVWRWLAASCGVWRWLAASRGVWRWLAAASGCGQARIPVVRIGDDLM